MPAVQQAPSAPFMQGSILWERKGPLPVWGWLAVGLMIVLAVTMWRRNKAADTATQSATGGYYRDELPGDQSAPPIFIVPQAPVPAINVNPTVTVPTAPPGGGASNGSGTGNSLPTHASVPGPTLAITEWVRQLNEINPGLGLSTNRLLDELNPGSRKYTKNTPIGLVFNPQWSGRNPPLGIPPMRIR